MHRLKKTPLSAIARFCAARKTQERVRSGIIHLRFCVIALISFLAASGVAHAENGCPAGYTPWQIPPVSMADCVALPDYGADELEQRSEPETSPEWREFAAAVAWGDSDDGSQFIGVSKYISAQSAGETVLRRCRANGWRNCEVTAVVTNGVIVVARDSAGNLRTRTDGSEKEARARLNDKCRSSGVTCTILRVYDGSPEFF